MDRLRPRLRLRSGVSLTHPHRWVDQQHELEQIIDELLTEQRYAIDTEFHRERTYFPTLALVQLGWGDGHLALVDPLAVEIGALRRLFESDVEAVFHAAQQDLDVLTHAVGAVPEAFFDTQIGGGFVGYGTPSLVSLLSAEVGVSPPKGDRLTDWLRRPLTEAQRDYAAADVAYLLEVQDRLTAKLDELGRMKWVEEACQELQRSAHQRAQPRRCMDAAERHPRASATTASRRPGARRVA